MFLVPNRRPCKRKTTSLPQPCKTETFLTLHPRHLQPMLPADSALCPGITDVKGANPRLHSESQLPPSTMIALGSPRLESELASVEARSPSPRTQSSHQPPLGAPAAQSPAPRGGRRLLIGCCEVRRASRRDDATPRILKGAGRTRRRWRRRVAGLPALTVEQLH